MTERTAWRCVLRFRRAGITARAKRDASGAWWVIASPGGAYVAQHCATVGRVSETLAWLTEPCENCGHYPCECDAMRAAHDLLYGDEGWLCPACGVKCGYAGQEHDCMGDVWPDEVDCIDCEVSAR